MGGKYKLLVICFVAILIINMILFALRITNAMVFWAVILACGFFSYYLLPKLKK